MEIRSVNLNILIYSTAHTAWTAGAPCRHSFNQALNYLSDAHRIASGVNILVLLRSCHQPSCSQTIPKSHGSTFAGTYRIELPPFTRFLVGNDPDASRLKELQPVQMSRVVTEACGVPPIQSVNPPSPRIEKTQSSDGAYQSKQPHQPASCSSSRPRMRSRFQNHAQQAQFSKAARYHRHNARP